jgi:tetratricopeptide (TPR) repeat protein
LGHSDDIFDMKKAYKKKIEHKKIKIRDSKYQTARTVGYDEAMSLVNSNRNSGKYQAGQFYLEQIAEQVKNVPEPSVYLMSVYLEDMQIEKAGELKDQLLSRFPRDNMVLRYSARFYQFTDNIEKAFSLLKKAILLHPSSAENYELQGLFYRSMGEPEKALKSFEHALKLDPKNGDILLEKAKILKANPETDFIEYLENLVGTGGVSDRAFASVHFALSWLYESVDVDRHFSHLEKANKQMSQLRPYSAEQRKRSREQTISKYSQKWISAAKGVSTEEMSPIFIVALARSGTTLLEQMLVRHSQLHGVGESAAFHLALRDEMAAGNSLLSAKNLERERSSLEASAKAISARFKQNYFVKRAGELRVVDKSIENYREVAMILTVFPRARIIDLTRNPLDTIYSCYRQDFTAGNNYSFNLESLADNYVQYKYYMDHWRKQFPGSIYPIRYEDLVQNQERVLRGAVQFCNLEWESALMSHNQDSSLIKTASDAQVRKPLNAQSINGWRRVEKHLTPAMAVLAELGIR